jgi:precorrin-3B synthase
MPSGDGLLVRLHLPCGILGGATARGIADCARRFGNGLLDLTRHGNLQLRGVSEATLPALTAQLSSLLLLPPDHEPQAARNIMASPLAGLDARARCDIRPIVVALRERLASDRLLRTLPPKFSILVDDGGLIGLGDIDADIRFEAIHSSNEERFAVALAGRAGAAVPIGICTAPSLPDTAIALARAFLELRHEGEDAPRRMAELVRVVGAEVISELAGVSATRATEQEYSRPARGEGKPPIGFRLLGNGKGFFGIGAPFGRLSADQLEHLAAAASDNGSELRLTPWRVVLIAGVAQAQVAGAQVAGAQVAGLRRRLASAGLITEPDDPRLAIASCPGTPSCSRATVATRDDALLLAPLARGFASHGVGLHLSGCAKGCAMGDATAVTLVGRDGRYDLVLDGRAKDAPSRSGLTSQEAKAVLHEMLLDRRSRHEALQSGVGRIG